MGKKITCLTFLLAVYSQNGFCDWIKTGSEDNRSYYVDSNVIGKYWIRTYRVLWESPTQETIKISGVNHQYFSMIQEKSLDCLLGNAATRSMVFYSDTRGTGERFIPTDKSFGNNFRPNQTYDYRWFQFNREYDNEVFKYVCGDLFTLRNQHLFWKIPRQSPM